MSLFSYSGFRDRVCELSRRTKTRRQAYEIAEDEHENAYGIRKYSSYNSFKASSSRRRKRKS